VGVPDNSGGGPKETIAPRQLIRRMDSPSLFLQLLQQQILP